MASTDSGRVSEFIRVEYGPFSVLDTHFLKFPLVVFVGFSVLSYLLHDSVLQRIQKNCMF